ncbi:MAG: hypothetical protein PHQ52_06400 [Candidatus Omnitrophica bacterium]|nr:hypothetical protein [Candidatus Omnitrophota bacterium]
MKKTKILLIVFLLVSGLWLLATDTYARSGVSGRSKNTGAPTILEPRSELAIPDKEGRVEFKWKIPGQGSYGAKAYIDFRVYKGYYPYEEYLIYSEQVKTRTREVYLDGSMFQPDQGYTMTVRLVASGSRKSREVSQSFKVGQRK